MRGGRGEFDIGIVTGLVLVRKTTVAGAALVPKRHRNGPLASNGPRARDLDDLKCGGGGAQANSGAAKRSGGNGRKRRSEKSAAKPRHGFESDEALNYAGICHRHGGGYCCERVVALRRHTASASLKPKQFISYLFLHKIKFS